MGEERACFYFFFILTILIFHSIQLLLNDLQIVFFAFNLTNISLPLRQSMVKNLQLFSFLFYAHINDDLIFLTNVSSNIV